MGTAMRIELRPTLLAPREARYRLAEWMRQWGCDERSIADASLVASELVTNAVVHAHSPPVLVGSRTADRLRLEVHDRDPSPPVTRSDGPGGYGLRLVDRLSATWGWHTAEDGKVVWVEQRCEDADAGDRTALSASAS